MDIIRCRECQAVLKISEPDLRSFVFVTFYGRIRKRFFLCPMCKNHVYLPDEEG